MDAFLRKVLVAVESRRLLRRRDSVLVGVSGGPDSVALLAALVALGAGRWRVGAVHVNHGLRGRRGDADERFVVDLGRRLGVEVHVRRVRLRSGANLEERARERRYRAFDAVAGRHGYRRVATAHTLDDQAETFLLRLLRGAGLQGLGAIAPSRGDGVVRPLLDCTREEVLRFLARRRLAFRTDATNRSLRFTRNRVRARLLPLLEREFNPAIRRTLARTAALVRDDEALLRSRARSAARRLARGEALDAAALGGLPVALARRVVRLWLEEARGGLRRIGADHVERALALAASGPGEISLPGGRLVSSGGRLLWRRGPGKAGPGRSRGAEEGLGRRGGCRVRLADGRSVVAGSFRLRLRRGRASRAPRPGPWRAVFDRAALDGAPLEVRPPRPGERVRPLGLGGSKKLQDVFVDAKVPRRERAGWPVVRAGAEVLWVPGLVRAEAAKVGPRSREVVVVEAERIGVGP